MISRAGHAGHVARKLGDIVKLPLLRKEPKEKIREIWRGHHAERHDAVGTDIDASAASLLTDRAAAAPTRQPVSTKDASSTRVERYVLGDVDARRAMAESGGACRAVAQRRRSLVQTTA